jgi:hypothetical protein
MLTAKPDLSPVRHSITAVTRKQIVLGPSIRVSVTPRRVISALNSVLRRSLALCTFDVFNFADAIHRFCHFAPTAFS